MSASAWRKRALRRLGAFFLRALVAAMRPVPLQLALALGRRLGDLARLASRGRCRVARENLRLAFGDALSEAEARRIVRESFRHFGMFAVESMVFPYRSPQEIARRLTVDGAEHLEQALRRGRGCIIVTAHLGSFELPGRYFADLGHEMFSIARPARDEATTRLVAEMRARNRLQVVTTDRSLRPILAALKRNACVAIVCDQNATDLFVPFFGHLAGTAAGPARLALKTGAPMLSIFTTRDGNGHYTSVLRPLWRGEPSGNAEADERAIMALVNDAIEAAIRRTPEQWLWFHDRWRSARRAAAEGRLPSGPAGSGASGKGAA